MNKEFKIIEGNYTDVDDVSIQIDTTEIVTNRLSSVFNIGTTKKEIELIEKQIEDLNIKKSELQTLLENVKHLTDKIIIKENE